MPRYAQVRIDWERRDFQVLEGMEGDSEDLPFGRALGFVAQEEGENVERYAAVYWGDVNQLCFYGVEELVRECMGYHEEALEEHLSEALAGLPSPTYVELFLEMTNEDSRYGLSCLQVRPPSPEELLQMVQEVGMRDPGGVVLAQLLSLPEAPGALRGWMRASEAAEFLEHASAPVRLATQRLWGQLQEEAR